MIYYLTYLLSSRDRDHEFTILIVDVINEEKTNN